MNMIDKNDKNNKTAGFTLIEMLIAIFIFALISIAIVALVSNVFVSSSKQSGLLADSDQARRVAFSIINELRNSQPSSTGAYSLESAGNQTLIFFANIDGGTDTERVRYYVQSGKLYKGITKPSGNPLAYNTANERTGVVQNNLANGVNPVFYYYDGDYTGTQSALSQPVDVTDVKLVKLDLKVYNKAGVANTNFYSVAASGSVRNLKVNLGD
jgi:prepilin-type N-terminal cleavage/methylation domain-containing protein